MSTVLRPHRTALLPFVAAHPEVMVLSADLTASCEADLLRDRMPERFLSLGMAEQNMVGFAAGMAREGLTPWLHTFAVFLTRRTFDQVAMSVAYPNLRVRLAGFLPGITTPGGVTHQAVDDLALMRAIPNMTVLSCGDATDCETVLEAAQAVDGPVYLRILRGVVPRLFPVSEPLQVGCCRVLSRGSDVAILTEGICTEEGLRAAGALRRRGLAVTHLHVSTLKPFPATQLLEALAGVRRGAVTLENHGITGGLGSAVAEVMAGAGLGLPLVRLGLRDVYAQGASREYLMRRHGLDAAALVAAVERLAGEGFDIPAEELTADVTAADEARVEDL
ncbi:MAG: transketolase [Deltaproteobacteria bacterium]|nr:transketolase [Deltaproteobacteria bacterium]